MRQTSWLVLTITLWAVPAFAQELTIETAPPIEAGLLIHSGTFAAQGSGAESMECTSYEDNLRPQIAEVRFDPPFREPPQVQIALTFLDFGVYDETPRNVRIRARAENLTHESMTLVVETWCDTNMIGAAGTYFAMGQTEEMSVDEPAELPLSPSEQNNAAVLSEQPASDLPGEW